MQSMVIEQLSSLVNVFRGPENTIKKYTNRKLDYDRLRSKSNIGPNVSVGDGVSGSGSGSSSSSSVSVSDSISVSGSGNVSYKITI